MRRLRLRSFFGSLEEGNKLLTFFSMSDYLKQVWVGTRLSPGTDALGRLVAAFGDANGIYCADAYQIASVLGNRRAEARYLTDKDLKDAERLLEYCASMNIRLLTYWDDGYPACLRKISDPPPWLFVKGVLPDFLHEPTVAVVGTREPSEYGKRMTYEIAYDLACAGVTTVSGLALGIDGIAAAATLAAGGKTVAVFGSGIDVIYPSVHTYLMREIVKSGCVISEFAPGIRPERWNFPRRNRVISALSDAVLVTCGSLRSGALLTARHATEQQRPIYALPGPVDTDDGVGPMKLLRDGARALSCADDLLAVLEERYPRAIDVFRLKEKPDVSIEQAVLRYRVFCKGEERKGRKELRDLLPHKKQREKKPDSEELKRVSEQSVSLGSEEQAVLHALLPGDFTVDELMIPSMSVGEICAALTMLEIYGFVRSLPGGRYRRLR